jgi:O-antigen/teichoic acid export membrane protein
VTAELGADAKVGTSGRPLRRGLASNSTAQLLSFAFRAAAGIGVIVLLARSGGPYALGVVQFALVLTSLLPFFYGVPALLAREVARRPDAARRWVEAGTLISLVFGVLFTGLLAGGAVALGSSRQTVLTVAIAALGMAFDGVARVQFAAFWAWERLSSETWVTGGQEAVYLAGTAIVLALGGGPVAVLIVFAGSRALGAVWSWGLLGRRLGGLPVPRVKRGALSPTLRQCTPFALSDTLTLANGRFDAVLLGFWVGPTAVGLYQAATNLVLHFNVVARSVNRALYPRMGRAWPKRPEEFGRLRNLSMRLVALIAVPVTVGSLLLAPRTIDFLYGDRFAPVVLTYQLLVAVIPIRMAANTMSMSLAATDRQTPRTIAVAAAAVLNVGLNVYLIPRFSYLGAGIATVISETLLLVAYATLQRRAAGPSELFRSNGWPLLACVPMAAAIVATRDLPFLVSAAAGFLAYAVAVAGAAAFRSRGSGGLRPVRALAALVEPTRRPA